MLEKHSGFRSSNEEAVRATFLADLGATQFDISRSNGKYNHKIHWTRRDDVTLVSSSCGSPTDVRFEPASFVRQYFAVGHAGCVRFSAGGETVDLVNQSVSAIIAADRPLRVESVDNHHLLLLRIETGALKRKLQAMLGIDIPDEIQFSKTLAHEGPRQVGMRQAVVQLASDLDFWGPQMLPSVRKEFEHALIARFLMCSQHNFSARLSAKPPSPSPTQLRRVADYIEANWNEPLDIETLSTTFDISSRSLFRHFRKFRDCTPNDFIKNVRLRNVKAMLEASDGQASVMSIALKCGFHSLGHFARDYREMFGELPSDTARRVHATYRH